MIKNLLPTDWYYVRCVKTSIEDNMLTLTWKVDVGEHKWRTLVDEFYLGDEYGLNSLWNVCKEIKYEPYKNIEDELFHLQFYTKRAKVYVDRAIDGQFKINRIIEYGLPDIPDQVNVCKPKDDSHFFENKNKRKLPIQ